MDKNIDIYDFDKTLVPFDSGSLFWGYCLLHYPWIIIFIPLQAIGGLLCLSKIMNFTTFKKFFFIFITLIPLDKAVKGFWNKHEKQVFQWFMDRKRPAIVISASPDFLLDEIKSRINIEYLLCSRHSKKSGAIIGENCRYKEKVRRFNEKYSDYIVHDVYSDSYIHDKPIFSLATENCYHIENGKMIKFDFNSQYK